MFYKNIKVKELFGWTIIGGTGTKEGNENE